MLTVEDKRNRRYTKHRAFYLTHDSLLSQSYLKGVVQSGQTHDTCAVPAIILQKKTPTNVERFTLTAERNAISKNLSFLLRA